MGRWSNYANSVKSSGGKYIRLKDGDAVKFAVTDADVGKRRTWWLDGKKVAEGTPESKMSEKMVLCVYDVDQQSMRVLEITGPTFRTLCEKVDEFGEDRIYRIKRYKDQKGFVAYAIDNFDRMPEDLIAKIAREPLIDILSEDEVEELDVEEPAPPPPPAKKPISAKGSGRPSAMPPAQPQAVDEDVPF